MNDEKCLYIVILNYQQLWRITDIENPTIANTNGNRGVFIHVIYKDHGVLNNIMNRECGVLNDVANRNDKNFIYILGGLIVEIKNTRKRGECDE